MPRQLRDYQNAAVDAVVNQWATGNTRTAVVLPTGAGKSTVIAALAVMSVRRGLSVALIAHRAELLGQMAATIAEVDPTMPPVGMVMNKRNEVDAPIIAASVDTLARGKNRIEQLGRRRVVLWDETHHVGAASYEKVLADIGGYRPDHYFCGFTATFHRDGGTSLRGIINSIAFERDLRWAIEEQRCLIRPNGLTVAIPELDLSSVKVSRTTGDFTDAAITEVMEAANPYVIEAIYRNAYYRRSIVFAASVDAAHDIAQGLTTLGLPAEAVTGAMDVRTEREPVYARFRSGMTRVLVTVMVLTEGADFPMCDCVVIARPTRSQNLYSQMVGRALRPYTETTIEGQHVYTKTDALVLDLVGTTRVLSLITLSDLDAGGEVKVVTPDGVETQLVEPAPGRLPKVKRQGAVNMVEIDLLSSAQTEVLWLATRKAGIPFVAPSKAKFAVYLWHMGNERYRVGWVNTRHGVDPAERGDWIDDGHTWSLEDACGIVERYVTMRGYDLPRHSASWRNTSKPSEGQVNYARTLGIQFAETMTKARLSDEIEIAVVSPYLDPV